MHVLARRNEWEWSSEPPESVGEWEMRCEESDFEPEKVEVYFRQGVLHVRGELVPAEYPVDVYSYNLTKTQWRRRRAMDA